MSVVHITTREHGVSLVWEDTRNHVDVQGLCITAHSSLDVPLQKAGSTTCPSIQYSRAGHSVNGVGKLPKGVNVEKLTPPLVCHGCKKMPPSHLVT